MQPGHVQRRRRTTARRRDRASARGGPGARVWPGTGTVRPAEATGLRDACAPVDVPVKVVGYNKNNIIKSFRTKKNNSRNYDFGNYLVQKMEVKFAIKTG